MRIACVFIPSYAVAIERRTDPRQVEQPLVVYDRNAVLDASPEAAGVRRGLPLRQAKALCPHAVFVEANHALYREVTEAMLDALESVAPCIEPAGLGVAYADIGGLQGHYEDEFALAGALIEAVRNATALLASVGIANGTFVAWTAASSAPPGDAGIVPQGREQEFLQDKDVSLLSFGSAQDKPFGAAQDKLLPGCGATTRAGCPANARRHRHASPDRCRGAVPQYREAALGARQRHRPRAAAPPYAP